MRAWRRIGRALVLLLLVGPAAELPAWANSGELAELNRRWAGGRCRIRLNVPIKRGRDRDGWSQSIWIVPRTEGAGLGGAKLSVSDRDRVVSMLPESKTPEGYRLKGGPGVARGTAFIAEGWEFQNPSKQTGLVLSLRFAKRPARAKMVFRGKRGGELNRDAIQNAERWARIELFELQAADEELVEVPAAAPRAPEAAAPTRPPAAPDGAASAELRVLGVAVEPLRAVAGGEIELVVTYSLSGVPAGRAVEVLERRRILRGGDLLTTLEARIARRPGTHESRQPLRIPIDLAAGIYEVRASVEGAGPAAEGSAIFQVIAGE